MNIEKAKEKFKGNKDVLEIIAYYEDMFSSPFYEGFVTIKKQLLSWQENLKDKNITISADGEDKSFERAHKFLTELKPYYDQLEYFRQKLTVEQVRSANLEAKTAYEMALDKEAK